jgi:hypothetical protein
VDLTQVGVKQGGGRFDCSGNSILIKLFLGRSQLDERFCTKDVPWAFSTLYAKVQIRE